MTFFVILYVGLSGGMRLQNGQPSILRAIVEDSTVYFLIILAAHLLSVQALSRTRVRSAVHQQSE